MSGNLFTGPTPYEMNPEAAEWLFKVLRGLEAPFAIRDSVNGLKDSIILYLNMPEARVRALMRTPSAVRAERREERDAHNVNCPTCGQGAKILANEEKCPKCTKPMVMRRNRTNGQAFLGCTGWPTCTGTRNLQMLLLERASVRRSQLAATDMEPSRQIEIY